jgi:hydroxymethylbilane synthase
LKLLRIGTRGSPLALWQANWVSAALRQNASVESELVIVRTSGDKFQQTSFAQMGTKGVFIKELEDALLDARIDIAVHSMKDVPTELPESLTIAAICKRHDVRDALISARGTSFADLARGSRVGTSSLRRRSQLAHVRGDLTLMDIRGNVDTRIEKLRRGDYDAIVLAKAGLDRLGLSSVITEVLPQDLCLPAAGQGAVGIEARSGDAETVRLVASINDSDSSAAVLAERSALAGLEGGCQVSIGAWARMENGRLVLDVVVLSPDGSRKISERREGNAASAVQIGEQAAAALLAKGASALLARQGRETRA